MRSFAFLTALAALASPAFAAQTKPDVILVVWDATRADHLTPYGYERDTTPNLKLLADRSLVFEDASATGPWTLPSVAGIFTGMFNHNHGVDLKAEGFSLDLPEKATTMAEMMKSAGYATGIWTAQNIFSQQEGFLQGFDKHVTPKETPIKGFIDAAMQFVDEAGDQPAFVILYLLDPHAPYEAPAAHDLWRDKTAPPVNIRGCPKEAPPGGFPEGHVGHCDVNAGVVSLTPAQWQQLEDRYDAELHSNDAFLGQLMTRLEERGARQDTAMFLTSDHGEAFNDQPDERTWHRLPYHPILHVPLIAYIPGVAPRRVSTVVRNLDIYATMAEIAGAKAPPTNSESLLALAKKDGPDRPVSGHSHFAGAPWFYREGAYKIIASRLGKPFVHVFDVRADPLEKNDLAASRPDLVEQLTAKRKAFLETSTLKLDGSQTATTEELDRLRALGYVD